MEAAIVPAPLTAHPVVFPVSMPGLVIKLPEVGVGVGVGAGVGVLPLKNWNQFMLNKYPLPPVNFRYKLCSPLAPLTLQVLEV